VRQREPRPSPDFPEPPSNVRLSGRAARDQVLEVVAETEAPRLPYGELLAGAACEEPQAARVERLKAAAAAEAELAAATERVRGCLLAGASLSMTRQSATRFKEFAELS